MNLGIKNALQENDGRIKYLAMIIAMQKIIRIYIPLHNHP